MKVLFVYPQPRSIWYRQYLRGDAPSTVFYGLPELKSLGFEAEFSDRAFSRLNLLKWLFYPLEKWIITKTGIGFKLDQALLLLGKARQADAVVTSSDSSGLPFALLKRLGLLKTPVFYTTIGLAGQYRSMGPNRVFTYYRKLFEWVDRIIVYTPAEADVFIKTFNLPKEKIIFLPIGVDARFFRPGGKKNGFILTAGRDLGRDYSLLFRVAKELPGLKFKVICSRRNIAKIKVPENVSVEFDVSYHDLRKNYQKARLLVLPLKETQRASGQTVLLEAMATGLPVIVSGVKGLSEVYDLKSGVNCLFVPVNNTRSLKNAILKLQRNPLIGERIGKNSRKLAGKKYSQKCYGAGLGGYLKAYLLTASTTLSEDFPSIR